MQPHDPVARFRGVISGADVPAGLLASPPDEVAQRVAVYRNNVAHSLAQALARRYPVVQRLVGAEFFAAMAAPFCAAHPPRSPVLQEWGGAFPGFLAGFAPVAGLPYLPDVARIEWARGLAYHAADATPLAPEHLTADRPLALHPSLRLLRLSHPAISIWQANQPGGTGLCRTTGPEIALIWRSADFQVPVLALTPQGAALIEALLRGLPLTEAAAGCDPVPVLALLLRNTLVCKGIPE